MQRLGLKRSKLLAVLAAIAFAFPNAVLAQTKDSNQTSGTAAPSRADVPAPDQSQQPASTQSAPTNKPSRDGGVKIDPVQAAKTFIDIFGKKKKPKPQVEPQPAPVPARQAEEATLPPAADAPSTGYPTEKAEFNAMPPISRGPVKPAQIKPKEALVTQPIPKSPVQQTPITDALPPSDIGLGKPSVPSATSQTHTIPGPTHSGKGSTKNIPVWQWIALLSAIAALIALVAKWYFFPSAKFDLAFETGESRIIKTASPFVSLPEITLELEFDWGMPSIPIFRFAASGDHHE